MSCMRAILEQRGSIGKLMSKTFVVRFWIPFWVLMILFGISVEFVTSRFSDPWGTLGGMIFIIVIIPVIIKPLLKWACWADDE